MIRWSLYWTLCALFLAGALELPSLAANGADHRKRSGDFAMQRAFGEFDRSSSWCDNATTTSTNIWTSSFVPLELKTSAAGLENRRAIRQIIVQHVDGTNTTAAMCLRLGPDTDTTPTRSTLTCDATSGAEQTNGIFLFGRFASQGWTNEEFDVATTPLVFVKSSTGTVRYCAYVFWKS